MYCIYFNFRFCTFATFGKASVSINSHNICNCVFPLIILYHIHGMLFWDATSSLARMHCVTLHLFFLSKARRTSKSLEDIKKSIDKFVEPGASIKDYSVYNGAGFWENVCKDLGVPNTRVNRVKICKATIHLHKVICNLSLYCHYI